MEKKPNFARAEFYVNMGAILSISFSQFWTIVQMLQKINQSLLQFWFEQCQEDLVFSFIIILARQL
jgi:hypothetical protein